MLWELNLRHPVPEEKKNFAVESIWFNPKGGGNLPHPHQHVYYDSMGDLPPPPPPPYHNGGYGWKETSNDQWMVGAYRVDLYVDRVRIASESFTVY